MTEDEESSVGSGETEDDEESFPHAAKMHAKTRATARSMDSLRFASRMTFFIKPPNMKSHQTFWTKYNKANEKGGYTTASKLQHAMFTKNLFVPICACFFFVSMSFLGICNANDLLNDCTLGFSLHISHLAFHIITPYLYSIR